MLVEDKTFCASSQEDKQPTVQALTAHSAHLLSRLANDLLAAEPRDVSAGLRVIRDELLALATAIRELEPEELPLREVLRIHENKMNSTMAGKIGDEVLPQPKKEFYTFRRDDGRTRSQVVTVPRLLSLP
jgi:hypothetical protein